MRCIAIALILLVLQAGCAGPEARAVPKLEENQLVPLLRSADLPSRRVAINQFWDQADTHRNVGQPRSFKGVGDLEIVYRYWRQPGISPAVVISSGRTEHMGKYREVVYDLWQNGYSVYIHDHRGQGESARLLADPERQQMGHVEQFADYVTDLHQFVIEVVQKGNHPHSKFLVGHSMGGGIATLYLLEHPEVFQGAVLASPMHQPDTAPLRLLGCWFMKITEGWRADQWVLGTGKYKPKEYGDEDQIYTTNKDRYTEWFTSESVTPNQWRIGGMSRRWVAEACKAADAMLAGASRLNTPVMVLQSVDDKAVVPVAQDHFCKAAPQPPASGPVSAPGCHPHGMPVPYQGAKHELFIERDDVRMDAMRRMFHFFDQLKNKR